MPDNKGNYRGEKAGLKLLSEQLAGVHIPTKDEKKYILELLGIAKGFLQTFDALRLNVPTFAEIKTAKDFDILEVKTTEKELPELPKGFFFGLTENEQILLKVFQQKYYLAFVSTHPRSQKFALVGWKDLESLIQHKRIQYQINLSKPEKKAKAAKIGS